MAIVTDIANFYPLRADANDDAGSNNGSVVGVSFVASGSGFDVAQFGAGDRIDCGASSAFSISGSGDFTVSAWVNPTSTALTFGQIFGSVVTASSSPQYTGFQFVITAGVLRFRLGGGGAFEDLDYTLPGGFAGAWHHVAITRSGTTGTIYVDGAQVSTTTFSATYNTYTTTANHKMAIGAFYNIFGSAWVSNYSGDMSDVADWTRALSGAEITQIHAAGLGQLAALMQLEAQGLFASVVHDLPTGPPIYARTLFASVVHEGTAAPSGGGSTTQGDAIQGTRLQGRGLQGNSLQGGS